VFVDQTLPLVRLAASGADRERRRARRGAVVTKSLQTARYTARARFVCFQRRAGLPPSEPAPEALAKAHKRLFRAAQFFAALPAERRHRVRILAKRLRYALDVFSSATEELPSATSTLSELQECLMNMARSGMRCEIR
jgi:hypothetical protein